MKLGHSSLSRSYIAAYEQWINVYSFLGKIPNAIPKRY